MKPDDFDKIISKIKSKPDARGYYVFGDEAFIKGQILAAIRETVIAPDFAEFNYHEFRAKELRDPKALADAILAIPMMAERRLVVLREVENGRKALHDVIGELNIPEGCVFVAEANPQKKTVAFHKRLVALLEPIECTIANDREMTQWVAKLAERAGVKISSGIVNYLVERAGVNIQTLAVEIDKLGLVAEGKPITKSGIDEMTATSRSVNIFRLADSFTNRNFEETFELVESLLEFGESVIMLVAILKLELFKLIRAKSGEAGLAKVRAPAWKLKFYKTAAGKWTIPMIRNALIELGRIDVGMKSGKLTEREAIIQALAEISLKS
ncbi:MAG TPA: DNA polymerase III subunit delta [candidate division Zixibacteria bacterium]|nr:DNA polymerase III subunit delta [candidate division Zixibacteria bacterium]